jgi:hypothetical protein
MEVFRRKVERNRGYFKRRVQESPETPTFIEEAL